MPLMLFIMLGTLQLFMMLHARILTQLAAFQATRAGSLNHANCDRMLHAGILQVLPAIEPFAKPTGTSLANNVALAFAKVAGNTYTGKNINIGTGKSHTMTGAGGTGAVMWIVRDFAGRAGAADDDNFDQSVAPMRLETQVVFWFPMRIPFANWIFARMMLAHYGMQAYSDQNPLMIRQKANWTPGPGNNLSGEMKTEIQGRLMAQEYVFPIVATYTMRMMTPLKAANLLPKNCPLTPATL